MKTSKTCCEERPYEFRTGALDCFDGHAFDQTQSQVWKDGWQWASRSMSQR